MKWFETLYKWATVDKILITKEAIASFQGSANANPFRGGHRRDVPSRVVRLDDQREGDRDQVRVGRRAVARARAATTPRCRRASPARRSTRTSCRCSAKNPQWGYKWIAISLASERRTSTRRRRPCSSRTRAPGRPTRTTRRQSTPARSVYYAFSRPYGYHYFSDIMNEVMYDTVTPGARQGVPGQADGPAGADQCPEEDRHARQVPELRAPARTPLAARRCQRMSTEELAKWGVHPYTSSPDPQPPGLRPGGTVVLPRSVTGRSRES